MPVNLIKQTESLFHEREISAFSKGLGESGEALNKAINIIIPFLFSALLKKQKNTSDTKVLISIAKGEANKLTQTPQDKIFTSSEGDNYLLGLFFDEETSTEFENDLSHFTQINKETAHFLTGLSAVAVLAFLGKYFQSNNLNSEEALNLLQNQEKNIAEALPQKFYTKSLSDMNTANKKNAPDILNVNVTDEPNRGFRSGLKWLIPLFVLAVGGGVALYLSKDESYEQQKNTVVLNADSTVKTSSTLLVNWPSNAGDIDSTGDYSYNEGNKIDIILPNNAGIINVGQNSTEARLVNFLQSDQPVDTGRGNWFEFTNVHFNSGTTVLSDSSIYQLENIAKITQAFPTAIFKIGGYTDSTASEDANIILSKNRAAMVATKINNFGARKSSITGSDGYGSRFALTENFTAAGRSLHRRVAINVNTK